MHFRTPTTLALTAGVALLLAACSSTSGSSGQGMSMNTPAATSTMSSAAGTFDASDLTFAQMMAAHHLQAIQMSDSLLAKTGVDARVTALATRIKAEQQPEIDEMNAWLTAWGSKPVTSAMSGMSMGSVGMMSTADMDALDKASGATASRLFLTGMITHHSGAITMAKTEMAGGKNADARALAQNITTSQTAEIAEMKKLLAEL